MPPPEWDILCCTIGPRSNNDRVRAVLNSRPDWQALADLAAAHGVRPQLIRVLRASFWEEVPKDTKQDLEAFQRLHIVRSLHAVREIAVISDAFARNGIR